MEDKSKHYQTRTKDKVVYKVKLRTCNAVQCNRECLQAMHTEQHCVVYSEAFSEVCCLLQSAQCTVYSTSYI